MWSMMRRADAVAAARLRQQIGRVVMLSMPPDSTMFASRIDMCAPHGRLHAGAHTL